jgi:hypothetical protein
MFLHICSIQDEYIRDVKKIVFIVSFTQVDPLSFILYASMQTNSYPAIALYNQ